MVVSRKHPVGRRRVDKAKLQDLGAYEDVLSTFKRYDVDHNGVISFKELHALMCDLNRGEWSEAESDRLFLRLDRNHNGSVDINEFLNYIFATDQMTAGAGKSQYELVLDQFRQVDTNRNGTLDAGEFTRLMVALTKGNWDRARTEAVFSRIDADHSGEVDLDELLSFLFEQPSKSRTPDAFVPSKGAPIVILDITCAPGPDEYHLQEMANEWNTTFGSDVAVRKFVDEKSTGISKVTTRDGAVVIWDHATMVAYRDNPFLSDRTRTAWVKEMAKKQIPQLLARARAANAAAGA